MLPARSRQQRSPAQRPPRSNAQDLEALTLQEGRLPPIAENKTYPRATLTAEEIMALCCTGQDADSPDIGPPPVSRFMDDNVAKAATPSKTVTPEVGMVNTAGSEATSSGQTAGLSRPTPSSNAPALTPKDLTTAKMPPSTLTVARSELLKPSSKRKFGASYDGQNLQSRQPLSSKAVETSLARPAQDISKGTSLRDREAGRKSIRDRPIQAPRKALAAKSTNQVLVSPKKNSKTLAEEASDSKPRIAKEKPLFESERAKTGQEPARENPVDMPLPASIVDDVALYVNPPHVDADLVTPDTPVRTESAGAGPSDTPPPADISTNGEASRPSRRARPAISYAEPNLRDKMRRPTKELFDAVAGEGKFIQRSSSAHKLEDPGPYSTTKAEPEPSGRATTLPESTRNLMETSMSPLADKFALDVLPNSVLTTRRTRTSSVAPGTSLGSTDNGNIKQAESLEPKTEPRDPVHDVYEFKDSSSTLADLELPSRQKAASRSQSRRSSAAPPTRAQLLDDSAADKPVKETTSRKRASMAVRSKPRMAAEDDGGEETGDSGDSPQTALASLTRDGISRRRSMML